ncbi:MAG: N-acetylmuramoyl-L-alanine amidase [Oscillospiraceae bacterium]|nr:N-acetylmuramoyl-L-alanine amidase [Oscillospiraceae bacterium]
MFKKFIALFLVVMFSAWVFPVSAFVFYETEPSVVADDSVGDYPEVEQTYFSMLNLPDNMRGAIITPDKDFSVDDEVRASLQIDEILAELSEIGLNTVVLNTSFQNELYYDLDMNNTGKTDLTQLVIDKARARYFNVFLVYDINEGLNGSADTAEAINKVVSQIHRFTIKYSPDGIILDDYYNNKSAESYGRYMRNGAGIGFENWLYDSTEYLFETAGGIVRFTDNSIPVGIMLNDVWANSADNEKGSYTNDVVQALYDGFSDTKKYVENGYVDFLMLRSYGSIDDSALGFSDVAGWWSEVCAKNDTPMYIIHYNEKIGTSEPGWGAEDQLLKQLVRAKETQFYHGSVFNSYQSLISNPLNSTGTLTKYFENLINEETLDEELIMRSPRDLRFTTYEKTVDFAGSFDENFDVYFNNRKIQLNEAGNFYFECPLNIGGNVFTIRHKSKTYTYQIERKIITMRELDPSISEGRILRVDGGTTFAISAVAYKGASVTATVNGTAVALREGVGGGDEDVNSSYITFTGRYTIPDGIIETEQNLGKISVTATYQGYSRTLNGAAVIVNALPRPPEQLRTQMFDQDTLGTGEVVGTISPFKTADERVKYIRVLENNTHVFDGRTAGTLTDPAFNPEFGQLPAGTLDYLRGTQSDFVTTLSGKRFYSTDVAIFDDTGLGENNLVVKISGTQGGKSYFKIGLDYKTSYKLQVVGQNYYTTAAGDYTITNFSTASHVFITFDNVTSVTKLPGFESNLVFDAGRWEQITEGGIAKFRMVLRLRQAGIYSGNNAFYDSNGDLMLTFPVLTNNIQNMNIVIDPGHGYGRSATVFDPGAIGHVIEFDVNLAIAKKLEQRLKAMGARAVRLTTESNFILTKLRPAAARQYNCDLFISIHSNKVGGDDSVRGTEVYYYTPFSQPLAREISASISSYFTNNVYKDKANKNRGAKYTYFNVTLQHDFPSVLVETGFVSNMEDAMAMANSRHQDGIVEAIIKGIQNYISKSSISYSSDGSVTIPNQNPPEAITPEETQSEETQPEETTPPESTTLPEATTPLEASGSPLENELPEIEYPESEEPETTPPEAYWPVIEYEEEEEPG